MKKLITILTIILLLTGCGIFGDDGSDVEKFEPYTIGAWEMTSESIARYIGQSNLKTTTTSSVDTVIIDQPGQRHLELVSKGLKTYSEGDMLEFEFTFRDSTISNNSNININAYNFIYEGTNAFDIAKKRQVLRDTYYEAQAGIYYNCWEEIPSKDIKIRLMQDDDTPFRIYVVKSNGFKDVLQEFCSN